MILGAKRNFYKREERAEEEEEIDVSVTWYISDFNRRGIESCDAKKGMHEYLHTM